MIPIDDKTSRDLGRHIVGEIRDAVRDRKNAEMRRNIVHDMYHGDTKRLDIHWEGASDIHLPLIAEKVETATHKLYNALLHADPIVHVRRAADDPMPEETRQQEQFLNWALESDIYNFHEAVEDWIRNTLMDPVATIRAYWETKFRPTVEVHRVKRVVSEGETGPDGVPAVETREKEFDEVLIEIFGMPIQDVSQAGILEIRETESESAFELDIIEDHRLYENVHVEILDGQFVDEYEVRVTRYILTYDAPRIEAVSFEDIITPFRSRDIQESPWVAQQYWLTPTEIQELVDAGEWNLSSEDMERVWSLKKPQEEMVDNDDAKRQLDFNVGEEGAEDMQDGMRPFSEGKVLVFEVFTTDDHDGDGQTEEVIYQVVHVLEKVAHAEYLDAVYPHGRRPFADSWWIPVHDRRYGISMGEQLAPIQVQINTAINQINDNQELINNPFYFYQPTAFTAEAKARLEGGIMPGQGIPVQDANAIHIPQWTQQPLANLGPSLDSILVFADRLTVSPLQGGSTQMRNAPRTARGTLAIISEGNANLDHYVRRMQRGGWNELIHQIFALYQSFMPDTKYFYVTNESDAPKRNRISHKAMRGRYTFQFKGNTVNTNQEIQRILSQQRYQIAMTNPLYANDAFAMRELLRDVLQNHSEGTDVDRLLPRLPGQGTNPHPPMRQQEENQAMKSGIHLDALPSDPHPEHIQVLDQFVNSKEFDQLPPEVVTLFATHRNQHVQMLRAMRAQEAQFGVPGGGGGAEQGVAQDVGLGELEGGIQ